MKRKFWIPAAAGAAIGVGFLALRSTQAETIAAIDVALSGATAPAGQSAPESGPLLVLDDPIRSLATSSELPLYPKSAVESKTTGVVVALVRLDPQRRVENVEVLESPSADIETAVRTAVMQWRFRDAKDDPAGANLEGKRLTGKLTFYFFETDGQYRVAGPKDAPLVNKRID